MNRKITDVRWANDRKTQVFCRYQYDDGRIIEAHVSDTTEGNPDWKEIMETFDQKILDQNTQLYLKDIQKKRDVERQKQKEREEFAKNEMLFNAKLEAFSIDEIKSSKNSALKSKIRKAKSLTEIYVYSSLLVNMEMAQKNDNTEEQPVETTEEPAEKPKRKYTKKQQ